jgi:hypothetical protein
LYAVNNTLTLFEGDSWASRHSSIDESFEVSKTISISGISEGIFRKMFPISEIVTVRRVRNHWYYGWGIRLWFWPKMWIFNVAGLDAVELTMKNGKIYRIGTDEPEGLESAVRQAINKK